jgi:N-acetylglucosaminyldiphosphoundecaprenol N-acetyl-beta-D-mannosaminyltransferase
MKTQHLFGYSIISESSADCAAQALNMIRAGEKRRYLACANPHSLIVARKDYRFRKALQGATFLIPDGIGLVKSAHYLGFPVTERVTGSDIFLNLHGQAATTGGLRVFFLGSTPKVLDAIRTRMQREFPGITVCGIYSPPFKAAFTTEDNRQMVAAINAARPDVLWVGMTAPKQEQWICDNLQKLDVGFIGAVGAVFDFYSETKKRAPLFWQQCGLEWLHRLCREPGRLWQRSLKSAPIFLGMVMAEYLHSRFGRHADVGRLATGNSSLH